MIAALLATGIWSVSVLAAARGARHLGGLSANLLRLSFALPPMILAGLLLGLRPWEAATRPGAGWFLLSGLVGMGFSDILALYAYPRLGARVTTLLVNAGAPPVAALAGWLWQAEHPDLRQALAVLAILAGVVLVLRPRKDDRLDAAGALCALASAATFALASVMSRQGFAVAAAAGTPVHWFDSTVLRVGVGLAFSLGVFLAATPFSRSWRDGPGRWRQALPWLALNSLLGPGLGLLCYQWALSGSPAALVQATVAFTPVLVLVTTWLSGEERPDALSVAGTVLATGGVARLALAGR